MRREEFYDDPEETQRLAAENIQSQIWTAMPAIVVAVDLTKQTLSVQPAIQGSVTDADGVATDTNLPLLVDVPIVWPRAGGFALTFPIKKDDEVLVVFASRCIDAWWQSGGIGTQAELRMHDLSDGFAILAPTSQPKKLTAVSTTNAQLRNEAGDTYLEITPDGMIKLKAQTEIDFDAPIIKASATTKVEVNAPNVKVTGTTKVEVISPEIALNGSTKVDVTAPAINLNGAVTVAGSLGQSGGGATMSGGMTVTGGMTVNGIVVQSHRHAGVTIGSGTSGTPV